MYEYRTNFGERRTKLKQISDSLHLSKSPKKNRVVSRRLQDRRLWAQIEAFGFQKAAYCLTRGFAYICWGGRLKAISWQEVRSGYQDTYSALNDETLEFLFRCKQDYLRWSRLCDSEGLNRHAVMDILYFGKSLSVIDKSYKKRHGWAAANILAALALYRR